jgi:hypothetical protein
MCRAGKPMVSPATPSLVGTLRVPPVSPLAYARGEQFSLTLFIKIEVYIFRDDERRMLFTWLDGERSEPSTWIL